MPGETAARRVPFLLIAYALLVAASLAWEHPHPDPKPLPADVQALQMQDGGRLAYRTWSGASETDTVLLLHGSPGSSADFERLGRALAEDNHRVIALDLPGFGFSARGDLSVEAHARAALTLLTELRIPRVHVVGWSLGGAVALHLADVAPDRVASLTLMASVSDQAVEGSGNYAYEHAKYAAGWTVLSAFRYGTPHFGLLSGLDVMRTSMRNFWETDLRPLTGIMTRMRTPTLILHGRRDFLAPVRDAIRSHCLIAPSSLVLFDGTHFIPFMHVRTAASVLDPFFLRHNTPGTPALRQTIELDPAPAPTLPPIGGWIGRALVALPFWAVIALVAAAVAWWDRAAAVLAMLPVAFALLDFGVVVGGVLLGQFIRALLSIARGRRGDDQGVIGSGVFARSGDSWRGRLRRPFAAALAARFVPGGQEILLEAAARTRSLSLRLALAAAVSWVLWAALWSILSLLAAGLIASPLARQLGGAGLILGVALAVSLPRPLMLLLTREGRTLLRIAFHRTTRREYWPTLVQYLLLAPVLARLALRHGPATCTCCNPGISGGGGMIGESKKSILDSLAHSRWTLPASLIAPGPDAAARALAAIASGPELGGFPVILKPDAGQRGFAVKIARAPSDVDAYFKAVSGPVLVQCYHPGPHECGIAWTRDSSAAPGRAGSIFSITRKEFPVITGDGRRTLEQLILRHPRYHCQAAVFLERFASERERVLAPGEHLRLAQSGNHCQGTLFRDGADLITPDLERAIDDIARSINPPLDAGRFDLRYESEEALRRGEGFAIVELNGTAGESTNIYDPNKSIFWAYRVLAAQWRRLYELGAARRREGVRPIGLLDLLREIRKHYRERSGSALAD